MQKRSSAPAGAGGGDLRIHGLRGGCAAAPLHPWLKLSTEFRKRRAPRRRGYVLLIVLMVLAIAAAALAGVCRMSLERALFAERAQADLQRRWGVITSRSVLLPKADAVLADAVPPAGEARRELRLGGQVFTFVFGDEQAKANVNTLYRAGGLAGAERGVREVAAPGDLRIELRPLPDTGNVPKPGSDRSAGDDVPDLPPAFEAFGQLFPGARPGDLVEVRGAAQPVTAAVTCWGDGTLNFRRAAPEAIREVCGACLASAEIDMLLDLKAKHPTQESSEILDQLKLTDKARAAVDDLLIDTSSCHSLWIISRSAERNEYDLAVSDESGSDSSPAQPGKPLLFSW